MMQIESRGDPDLIIIIEIPQLNFSASRQRGAHNLRKQIVQWRIIDSGAQIIQPLGQNREPIAKEVLETCRSTTWKS